MDSESILSDFHNNKSDCDTKKYYELKGELIELLSNDIAIKTGDCNRTEYLLREVLSLLKKIDNNNEVKYKTTSLTVIASNSVALKFEPRENCGGNSYISKGAMLQVKKISEDGKWLFIKNGSFQGWIHSSNIEHKSKKLINKNTKKNKINRFISKYLKLKK